MQTLMITVFWTIVTAIVTAIVTFIITKKYEEKKQKDKKRQYSKLFYNEIQTIKNRLDKIQTSDFGLFCEKGPIYPKSGLFYTIGTDVLQFDVDLVEKLNAFYGHILAIEEYRRELVGKKQIDTSRVMDDFYLIDPAFIEAKNLVTPILDCLKKEME